MWIDDTGAAHTVWVPPADLLGEEAVAALAALPEDVRAATVADLDAHFDAVFEAAAAAAPTGPADLGDPADLDDAPSAPGLAPRAGESLTATVLAFLDTVPARWRVEVLEAVSEVLAPE
ncbi:hypothetical protein [Phycicoccus sonneratiae]|uniref:Uncharacterized protein n=1 Tax=Phycicoccus sonneratiae TaxID=2807628 RepID=A0ABS2CLM0_9MICO|nr:hypothetical protein [Phycicoccus sonneraticus]MBM6400792.1 hypothetical protein [Phycicoccus sonneraticus]